MHTTQRAQCLTCLDEISLSTSQKVKNSQQHVMIPHSTSQQSMLLRQICVLFLFLDEGDDVFFFSGDGYL